MHKGLLIYWVNPNYQTAAHDDPTEPSASLISCVSNGPAANQLNSLLQYIDSDPRIMLALEYYNESH